MIFVDDQGNYPRYIGDVLLVKPDWNSRKKLPDGWERVYEAVKPREYGNNISIQLLPVRHEDGKLYQNWSLVRGKSVRFDPDSIRSPLRPV